MTLVMISSCAQKTGTWGICLCCLPVRGAGGAQYQQPMCCQSREYGVGSGAPLLPTSQTHTHARGSGLTLAHAVLWQGNLNTDFTF